MSWPMAHKKCLGRQLYAHHIDIMFLYEKNMKLRVWIVLLGSIMAVTFIIHYFFVDEWDQVELEVHNEFIQELSISEDNVVILMYNHAFEEQVYPIIESYCLDKDAAVRQLRLCPYACTFTDDKSAIAHANAVVFSANNVRKNALPVIRHFHQYWVLWNMRPHEFTMVKNNSGLIDVRLFNITMGYRHDSDVHVPFGNVFRKMEDEEYDDIPIAEPREKKLIAWITTSNCMNDMNNSRTEFVKSLMQHVAVDIFGSCGENPCSPHKDSFYYCHDMKDCYSYVGQRYKFHLAIEDAMAEDYVTEKFFYALESGMVPIVLGGANYPRLAAPRSYIDIQDYGGVKALANHLLYLDRHPKEYDKFFQWQQFAYVTPSSYWDMGWCLLCESLWNRRAQNLSLRTVRMSTMSNRLVEDNNFM